LKVIPSEVEAVTQTQMLSQRDHAFIPWKAIGNVTDSCDSTQDDYALTLQRFNA